MKINRMAVIILCLNLGLMLGSCTSTRSSFPTIPDESLLSGTGTAEYAVQQGNNRWRYVTTRGVSSYTVTLTSCPNTITQVNFQKISNIYVRDSSFQYNRNDIRYYNYCNGWPVIVLFEPGNMAFYEASQPAQGGEEAVSFDKEPDIVAFKDNYLFNLNRYLGVVISDVSQPEDPYVEHILPVNGYPVGMVIQGRFLVLGVAGYANVYRNSDRESDIESSVQVWDVKSPDDAGIITEKRVPGELVQLKTRNAVLIALSTDTSRAYLSTFVLRPDGTLEARSTVEVSAREYLEPNLVFTRMVVNGEYAALAVPGMDDNYSSISTIYTYLIKPDGTLREIGVETIPGYLDDEHRMAIDGDVVMIFSSTWNKAYAHTISLKNGKLLQSVTLKNERLYASAFQGRTGYAITFIRMDPLIVVDFSDPENLQVLGELEVLGWSEQLYPMGDLLLGLGPQNARTALSLYDVSDLSNPKLLSRLLFGDYSASEAYNDYRAFTVVPEENLIAFPYTERRWWLPLTSYVQFVDLYEDRLVERGKVAQHGIVQRILPYQDNVFLSVSRRSVQAIDLSNRDNPVSMAELRLIRAVRDVIATGNYIIMQVDEGGNPWWGWWYPPSGLAYYQYEVVRTGEEHFQPVLRIMSRWPVVWAKEISPNVLSVLTGTYDTLSLFRIEIHASGGALVTGCQSVENVNPLPNSVGYANNYLMVPVRQDRFTYDEMTTQEGILVFNVTTPDLVKGYLVLKSIWNSYPYIVTYSRPLMRWDASEQLFYMGIYEQTYYADTYTAVIKPYFATLKMDNITAPVFEWTNIEGTLVEYLGDGRILVINNNTLSVYDTTTTPPSLLYSLPASDSETSMLDCVIRTSTHWVRTYLDTGKQTLTVYSHALTSTSPEAFTHTVIPLGLSLYPGYWYSSFITVTVTGDYVVMDGLTTFIDPVAVRNNRYYLEGYIESQGFLFKGVVLNAKNLSPDNHIFFTTTSPPTRVAIAENKLLVPMGLRGMDVIETGTR